MSETLSKAPSKARNLVLKKLADGVTKAQIAREIGYGPSAVSLYVSGSYIASVDKIEAAILRAYDRRICPQDGQEKAPRQCLRIALAPRPHGFPDADSLWQACQSCPHKPSSTLPTPPSPLPANGRGKISGEAA